MKQFNRKLSLQIDGLHEQIERVKQMPKSTLRAKALLELTQKLKMVERGIPCSK